MFLLITPAGGKLWRFKYRFDGKEKLLAMGTYPAVGLSDARKRREDARTLLANPGLEPGFLAGELKTLAARTKCQPGGADLWQT